MGRPVSLLAKAKILSLRPSNFFSWSLVSRLSTVIVVCPDSSSGGVTPGVSLGTGAAGSFAPGVVGSGFSGDVVCAPAPPATPHTNTPANIPAPSRTHPPEVTSFSVRRPPAHTSPPQSPPQPPFTSAERHGSRGCLLFGLPEGTPASRPLPPGKHRPSPRPQPIGFTCSRKARTLPASRSRLRQSTTYAPAHRPTDRRAPRPAHRRRLRPC